MSSSVAEYLFVVPVVVMSVGLVCVLLALCKCLTASKPQEENTVSLQGSRGKKGSELLAHLSPQDQLDVRQNLSPDEEVIWVGKPGVSGAADPELAAQNTKSARSGAVPMFCVVITLPLVGMGVALVSLILLLTGNPNDNFYFPLVFPSFFGLMCVCMGGCWMLSLLIASSIAGHTTYVLTNERCIIVSGSSYAPVRSYPFPIMQPKFEQRGRYASIVFERIISSHGVGGGHHHRTRVRQKPVGFLTLTLDEYHHVSALFKELNAENGVGKQRKRSRKASPSPSAARAAAGDGSSKFCMMCGTSLPSEAGFCQKCGTPQNAENA